MVGALVRPSDLVATALVVVVFDPFGGLDDVELDRRSLWRRRGRFRERSCTSALDRGRGRFGIDQHDALTGAFDADLAHRSVLGRHDEAAAAHRTAVEVTGGRYSHYVALLGNALALGGKHDEARAVLAELDARAAHEYVPPYDRAVVLTALGEHDAALGALEQAFDQRNAFLWARIHFPTFHALHGMPRYTALVERLNRRAPVNLPPR